MSSGSRNDEGLLEQKDAISRYLTSLFDTNPTPKEVAEPEPSPIEQENNIPKWASEGFSALFFRSAGLHLYLPVSFVRGIKNVAGNIQRVSDSNEWVKGVLKTKSGTITVVDTEKLLFPNRKPLVGYQHPDQDAYVVLLGDGSFGLSCDTIGQVKQVAATDIHWRGKAARRQYVSGMFKNEVAALLDARRIALAVSMDGALV